MPQDIDHVGVVVALQATHEAEVQLTTGDLFEEIRVLKDDIKSLERLLAQALHEQVQAERARDWAREEANRLLKELRTLRGTA